MTNPPRRASHVNWIPRPPAGAEYPSARAAARALHAAGANVLPIKTDGTKAPRLKTWTAYQRSRQPDCLLDDWFPEGPAGPGLAIIAGEASLGAELIDFDLYADRVYPQWAELVEDE